jgi:hypothetical protein
MTQLIQAAWSWGCVAAIDSNGRTSGLVITRSRQPSNRIARFIVDVNHGIM